MAQTKNNPLNTGGKKGRSGRKSHKVEREDYLFLLDVWRGNISKRDMKKALIRKRHGAKHLLIEKILVDGDLKALKLLMDKLFPNMQELSMVEDIAARTYSAVVKAKMAKFGVKSKKKDE